MAPVRREPVAEARRARISRGSAQSTAASPAAVPAAWPIAMHWAIERTDAWASCVAEKQRPATSDIDGIAGESVR